MLLLAITLILTQCYSLSVIMRCY